MPSDEITRAKLGIAVQCERARQASLGFTPVYFIVQFGRKCFSSLRGRKPEVIQLLPILKGRKFTNPNWTKSDFSCTFLHSFALTLHKIALFLHLKNCWVENPTYPLDENGLLMDFVFHFYIPLTRASPTLSHKGRGE